MGVVGGRSRGLVVAAALVVVGANGCGAGGGDSRVDSYVAMGDSFTSAPGVPVTDTETGCQRSDHNYPALLAEALDVRHVDVSCGSADTTAIEAPQQTEAGPKPPQLDAVERGTDLVTVGIGINDFGLYSSLLFNCTLLATSDPTGSPCRASMATSDGDRLEQAVDDIGPRVEAVLSTIRDRAPDARVVLVGYPQFVPPSGTCAELPLAEGDYPYVRELTERLGRTLEAAAEEDSADYVDLVAASRGHDICAGDEAWVNGAQDAPGRAVLYHPFPEYQDAVAELIRDLV
jgi:lysophospholipase L1-like esterase